MAKVRIVTLANGTEVTRAFNIPAGVEDRDVKLEGDWLSCFNPSKGELIYFRLPNNVKRVEIQYE